MWLEKRHPIKSFCNLQQIFFCSVYSGVCCTFVLGTCISKNYLKLCMTDSHSKEKTKSDLAVLFFCCMWWASRRLFLMLWSFLFFFVLVQVTEEVVKLLELKLCVRHFVSFWCHSISQVCSDLEGGGKTPKSTSLGASVLLISPFLLFGPFA